MGRKAVGSRIHLPLYQRTKGMLSQLDYRVYSPPGVVFVAAMFLVFTLLAPLSGFVNTCETAPLVVIHSAISRSYPAAQIFKATDLYWLLLSASFETRQVFHSLRTSQNLT